MSLYGTQSNEQTADDTDEPTLKLISQGSLSTVLCLAGKPLSSPRDEIGGSTRAVGNGDRDGDIENDGETEMDG